MAHGDAGFLAHSGDAVQGCGKWGARKSPPLHSSSTQKAARMTLLTLPPLPGQQHTKTLRAKTRSLVGRLAQLGPRLGERHARVARLKARKDVLG